MKVNSQRSYLSLAMIVGVALGLSVLSGILNAQVNSWYLEKHPFYGDTSYYYYLDNKAYWNSEFNGRWSATVQELLENGRNPLRIVPLLIFSPGLLATENGHLVIASFMLFLFLCMLGITILKRSRSLPYAFAGMCAVPTAEAFFDPVFGMGPNYPDLHASYLVGAALYALLNSDQGRQGKWLVLFGVFAALAALSRFVCAGYTLFICGPILLYYLLERWRNERSLRGVFIAISQIAIPILVLSGYYFILFTKSNLEFYAIAGYALDQPTSVIVSDLGRYYTRHLGTVGYVILMLFSFFFFVSNWSLRRGFSSLLTTAAAPVAQLILIVFVLKVADDWWILFYVLPGLYLLAFAPFEVDLRRAKDSPISQMGYKPFIFLLVILIWTGIQNITGTYARYSFPSNQATSELSFQRDSALVLNNLSEKYYLSDTLDTVPTFDTFFYEYGRSVVNEASFRYRAPLRWLNYFKTHREYWDYYYPGLSLAKLKDALYQQTLRNVDFAVVLSEPRAEQAKILFNNAWSLEIAEAMHKRIASDRTLWSHESDLESPWGKIQIYRNLKSPSLRSAKLSAGRAT